MAGSVNARAIQPFRQNLIPFNQGLDQSTPAVLAAPGSLRDCVNFELVDGYLQVVGGVLPMGKNALNATYDMYILLGTANTNFTQTGTITDKEIVYWYEDSVSLNQLLGTGIWLDGSINSNPYVGILHLSGDPPTDQYYFKGQTSAATITITDDDYRFSLPNDDYTNLSELVYSTAHNAMYSTLTATGTWGGARPGPTAMRHDDTSGVSHIVQANDMLYAVCDFPCIAFHAGAEEPQIGDKIQVDSGASAVTAYIAHWELTSGSWVGADAAGWLWLYPQSDSTLSNNSLSNLLTKNNTAITNVTTGNPLGNTPVQTGSNDVVVHKYHGLLWKLDTTTRTNTGWSFIHPGYSVRFGNDDTSVDQTAPSTELAPLFASDAISTLANTGLVAFNTPTELGSGTAWGTLTNAAADDGSYATCAIPTLSYSKVLSFSTTSSIAIPDTAKITGIEVQFEASGSLVNTIYPSLVRLRNNGITDDNINRVWQASNNIARQANDYLTASDVVYTYGGDLDLWGLEEVPLADLNANDISLELEFYNSDGSTRTVSVDYVWMKVYYTVNSKHVYFVRNGSDVTEGTIFAYQVMDGDWSTENATGWLSFDSIDDAGAVRAGDGIWTGTGGTGDFIGNVRACQFNVLPSLQEMVNNKTRSRTKVSSLGSEDGEQTAYCVNGIGPAWALDSDERVRMIRTPVSPEKDKPRFVEEHRNHLILGLKEHFIVSAIGSPDTMSTADGATTWHVRDRIAGMHHTTDGTTIILCRNSLHQFQGAAATGGEPFALSSITNKAGAKDYSSVEMGDIFFLTSSGLSTVSASDKFGDFESAALSAGIEKWLRDRINENLDTSGVVSDKGFLDAIPVKSKNQLRFYFNDGYILTATVPIGEGAPQFTFQNYGAAILPSAGAVGGSDYRAVSTPFTYKPTALFSGFTSWGEERIYMGKLATYPEVWLLDTGSTNYLGDTETIRGFLTGFVQLNPMFFGTEPTQIAGCDFVFDSPMRPDFRVFKGSDFEPAKILNSSGVAPYLVSTLNSGFEESVYTGKRLTYVGTSHIGGYSQAHSWAISTIQDFSSINQPLRLIAFAPKVQARAGDARAQTRTDMGTSLPFTR